MLKRHAHKVGAALYVVWGLLHLRAAYEVYQLASQLSERYVALVPGLMGADLTVPKWIDRLGGADIWTFDHCHQVIQSLRID